MGVRWPPNSNHLFYNTNYLKEQLYGAMQIGGVREPNTHSS